MASKKTKGAQRAEAVAEATTNETTAAADESVPDAAAEPPSEAEPKPKGHKRGAKTAPKPGPTLADVFAGYVDALDKAGKSDGTIASYRMELALAGEALGLETKIAEVTPEQVLLFFGSPRVTEKRNGKPKSPLSIDKTRRVLRQALQHAETAGLVAKAPLPEQAATH